MEMTVVRLAFLLGFLAISQCEEERAIRINVDGSNVYRNVYYVTKATARVSCLPPKESNDKYDELAIYRGNATKDSRPVCKGATGGGASTCKLTTGSQPSLSVDISSSEPGLYTCQYDKAPEPPVKSATVSLYFRDPRSDMTIYDESGQQIRDVGSLQVTNETSFRFLCPGTNEEGSKMHWYRNEHELKLEHNSLYELNDTNQNLTFKKNKNPDGKNFGGYYRCERISKDGKTLGTAFTKVNSHAFIMPAQKSYNKMEGESVTMSCDVDGEPVPTVTWKRNGKVLGADNSDDSKRFTFSSYNGIPHASVTISNLVAEDYGEYSCAATSPDGSHAEATTLLRVRSKLAALWPFLGIVAEVIILVAIIFIYEKRRAKKEQEETEDAADQKKSLTASNNENKDVRQRKA